MGNKGTGRSHPRLSPPYATQAVHMHLRLSLACGSSQHNAAV